VVELATVVMGPFGGQLLGDLGADIVKVETGVGDGSRLMGGGPHPELSGIALNLHRNKRSIGLDLKDGRGHDVLMALLRGSDVLITNLRPGPLRRLGLDYDAVHAEVPGLVYCQAQGFRTSSEEGDLHDRLLAAVTLDRWIEACENVARLLSRADAVNLDRKQTVLGSFLVLQSAMR
jgi:crotonobetainyl-CoA:carnitine CoA-transferase CaiB-like acyl-CoA transferase